MLPNPLSLEHVLPPEPEAVFFLLADEDPSLGLGEPSLSALECPVASPVEDEEDALPFSPAELFAAAARLKRL